MQPVFKWSSSEPVEPELQLGVHYVAVLVLRALEGAELGVAAGASDAGDVFGVGDILDRLVVVAVPDLDRAGKEGVTEAVDLDGAVVPGIETAGLGLVPYADLREAVLLGDDVGERFAAVELVKLAPGAADADAGKLDGDEVGSGVEESETSDGVRIEIDVVERAYAAHRCSRDEESGLDVVVLQDVVVSLEDGLAIAAVAVGAAVGTGAVDVEGGVASVDAVAYVAEAAGLVVLLADHSARAVCGEDERDGIAGFGITVGQSEDDLCLALLVGILDLRHRDVVYVVVVFIVGDLEPNRFHSFLRFAVCESERRLI